MTKIEVEIYEAGGVGCKSEDCKYRNDCANHVTAGDYRYEDGIKPELVEVGGEFFCATHDREWGDEDRAEYGRFWPKDYDERGFCTRREIKRASRVDVYQI